MKFHVQIRGDGTAARCCAHLLSQAGIGVQFEAAARSRVPTIMLGQAAQTLIGEIFDRSDLFADAPKIERRIVKWGPGASPVEVPHSAVVVSEELLLGRLGLASDGSEGDSQWAICAAQPVAAEQLRFGTRMASPMQVRMKPEAATDACWIESVEDGWLFLNSGWLAAVGARPEDLLAQSVLVKDQIEGIAGATVQFPASPRIASPLGGQGWLACGSAAIGFDPLCGDGTAHAVREAILASAVMRAVSRGEEAGGLIAHYDARLTAGFQRHLLHCRQFYAAGGDGAWWQAETEALDRGLEWCHRKMAGHGPFRYQLHDLELHAI